LRPKRGLDSQNLSVSLGGGFTFVTGLLLLALVLPLPLDSTPPPKFSPPPTLLPQPTFRSKPTPAVKLVLNVEAVGLLLLELLGAEVVVPSVVIAGWQAEDGAVATLPRSANMSTYVKLFLKLKGR